MAGNNSKHTFYPLHGPGEYSYTTGFGELEHKENTYAKAKENTAFFMSECKQQIRLKMLSNLDDIISGARTAEQNFLTATGIDLADIQTSQQIFSNFNTILNSTQLLQRNLEMLNQLSNNVNNTFLDPSKFFFSYVQEAFMQKDIIKGFNIKKAAGPQLEAIGNKIIGYALEKAYANFKEVVDKQGNVRYWGGATDSLKEGETFRESQMGEIVEAIHNLTQAGAFGKYTHLLKIDDYIKQVTTKRGNISTDPRVIKKNISVTTKTFDSGGTPLEVITATVAGYFASMNTTVTSSDNTTLQMSIGQTGSGQFNQQKGDVMLAYAKHTIDFSKMRDVFAKHMHDKTSTRNENVDALREYLETAGKEIEHLLVISDKNYKVNATWGGFSAQEKMSLANAGPMLGRFGVPEVAELINFLANSGTDMIQGEAKSEVTAALTTYVSYFLFDHIQITGPTNANISTNVVNILNVNNTYIPLSVYLEGVRQALDIDFKTYADSIVDVTLTFDGEEPDFYWTAESWKAFRTGREQNSFIEYTILEDIGQFITNLISSKTGF